MGIFNPSSSTPVSSAIFTDNGGLSLSVQNSVGYPIEITNITATVKAVNKEKEELTVMFLKLFKFSVIYVYTNILFLLLL